MHNVDLLPPDESGQPKWNGRVKPKAFVNRDKNRPGLPDFRGKIKNWP
jgi:hypothetical protein